MLVKSVRLSHACYFHESQPGLHLVKKMATYQKYNDKLFGK